MNLKEVGCGGMNWIELAQERDRWGDFNAIIRRGTACTSQFSYLCIMRTVCV
jgi:hypothetical protein